MARLPVILFAVACFGFASPPSPVRQSGNYEAILRLPADGLYAREEMQIEVRLLDRGVTGNVGEPGPIRSAKLRAVIDMPAMPGMPKFEEMAHPEAVAGEYGVHPTFPHGGEYRLRFTLLAPSQPPAAFEFPLEVADVSTRSAGQRIQAYSLQVASMPAAVEAGAPVDLTFSVRRESVMRRMPDGTFVRDLVTDFETVHEKLLHLIIVREDLSSFAHEHPVADAGGRFRLRYTFPTAGEYRLFADLAPKGAGSQVLLARLSVSGDPGPRTDITQLPRQLEREGGGLSIRWQLPVGGLPPARTQTVAVSVLTSSGKPAQLENWLGAKAHLLLVHQDGETFAHAHPDEREQLSVGDGRVPFLVRLPKPGLYRAWLQFQIKGEVVTSDFVLESAELTGTR